MSDFVQCPHTLTIESMTLYCQYAAGHKQECAVIMRCAGDAAKKMAEAASSRAHALINTPEVADFLAGVKIEAAHQVRRWGSDHDAGKAPEDWFWLIGYLAGKALRAALNRDADKALHHCISVAAVCFNWHNALRGIDNRMRPGIDPVERKLIQEADWQMR